MLRCIQRQETDPYFNLAAEEFLLKSALQDTFMTWRNEPSLIIGKHQNSSREINHSFIESNHLPVIRRITGGGTVFHDPGNLNFSFIYTQRKENLVDFRDFTKPIILFLQNLGLDAVFEGKNNIKINGLKVSGNSAHIYKNKVLHHGTLLFNTDLEKLEKAIASQEESYKDKAVRSVRAKVANIIDLLAVEISLEEFTSKFRQFILNYFKDFYEDDLHPFEIETVQKLAEEKYKSFRWTFGYYSEYEFNERWFSNEAEYSVKLFVKEGLVNKAELIGPGAKSDFLNKITAVLIGVQHEKKSISARLKKLTFADESEREIMNQISGHMF